MDTGSLGRCYEFSCRLIGRYHAGDRWPGVWGIPDGGLGAVPSPAAGPGVANLIGK
jgi:hypothetical protein